MYSLEMNLKQKKAQHGELCLLLLGPVRPVAELA